MDEWRITAWQEHLWKQNAFIAERLERARLHGGRLRGVIRVDRERGAASLTAIARIFPDFRAKPLISWRNVLAVEAAYGAAFCQGHLLVLAELFERACEYGIVF
jgi:hypothetical protein